jgi:hypothetical protein
MLLELGQLLHDFCVLMFKDKVLLEIPEMLELVVLGVLVVSETLEILGLEVVAAVAAAVGLLMVQTLMQTLAEMLLVGEMVV